MFWAAILNGTISTVSIQNDYVFTLFTCYNIPEIVTTVRLKFNSAFFYWGNPPVVMIMEGVKSEVNEANVKKIRDICYIIVENLLNNVEKKTSF